MTNPNLRSRVEDILLELQGNARAVQIELQKTGADKAVKRLIREADEVTTQILNLLYSELEKELETLTHYDRSLFRDGYTNDPRDRADMFLKRDVLERIKELMKGVDDE